MSTRVLCRLCLAMDVPMHDIADSPLQSVYKKLTNISLHAAPLPVAACYLCYCQLRKSHGLMVRCLKAHEVFTQLLRSGEEVNVDLINMKNREIQELNELVLTPVELIVIGSPGHSSMNTTIKDEPLSPQCKEEVDTDRQECTDNVIFEKSENEENFSNEFRRDVESTGNDDSMDREQINEQLEDAVDIESDIFPNSGDIKQEKPDQIQTYMRRCIGYLRFEGEDDNNRNELTGEAGTKHEQPLSSQRQELMKKDRRRFIDYLNYEDSEHEEDIERVSLTDITNIKNEEFIDEKEIEDEELEEAVVAESVEAAGAARAEKCKETRAGTRQDGGTLTPGGENVLEEQRTRSTEEEKMSRNIGRHQLRSTTTTKSTDCTSTKHSKRTFVCDDCGDVFGDKCLLIEHIEQHVTDNKTSRESSQQRTSLLNQKFSRTGAGNKHIEARRRFTCEICQVRFIRKGHLKAHLHRHTGEKPYECEICKAKFSRKGNLKKHLSIHTGEKPYECEVCKVRFIQKDNLKVHLRIHTGEKPFECEICKVSFRLKSSLNTHLRIHTGEKPYECDICKANFRWKNYLKRHLRIHIGEKSYECKICKVTFRYKITLKKHLKIHTGEKPYECEICKVMLSNKRNLKKHLRIHNVEKPHECEICKATFSDKSTLKKHLRTHTGEKPYECDICKVRYTVKESLKNHLRIHTGEKPYDCKICEVRFSHKAYLKKHLRIHTGEKPYECKLCKVRFRNKNTLNRHLRTHTGETKPYECEICKGRFSEKGSLKRHLNNIHSRETL